MRLDEREILCFLKDCLVIRGVFTIVGVVLAV